MQVTFRNVKPSIVVEPRGRVDSKTLSNELKKISKDEALDRTINGFYVHEDFPVDIRHNIKIDRKKLGEFARDGKMRQI